MVDEGLRECIVCLESWGSVFGEHGLTVCCVLGEGVQAVRSVLPPPCKLSGTASQLEEAQRQTVAKGAIASRARMAVCFSNPSP